MAAITTYATLVSNLKDLTEDDGSELSNYIPTAIDLAEERLFKELDLQDLTTKTSGFTSTDVATLSKPSGYRFAEYFYITVNAARKLLKKKTEDFIQDYWPTPSDSDEPKYYADSSSTDFVLAPTPNSSYAYEIKYTAQPTKLSTSNSTNYYTEKCKDLLFAACMVELVKFMKAWSQVPVWEGTYSQLRDAWNIEQFRKRRDGGHTPMNPDGGPNSLKHTIKSNA